MTDDEQADLQSLREASYKADDAFSEAVYRQYGGRATRWDVTAASFNAETRAAYDAKVKADDDRRVFCSKVNAAEIEKMLAGGKGAAER